MDLWPLDDGSGRQRWQLQGVGSSKANQQSAKVFIKNNSGGDAQILLFHRNSSYGTQIGKFTAREGETVGPLTVCFETGITKLGILDYWSVQIRVLTGPAQGDYVSNGTVVEPHWKECQLQHEDAGKTLTFSVDTTQFNIALDSGACSNEMTRVFPQSHSPITHVFVVMLENHSFDNMFAMSGIPGIIAATTSQSNSYNGKTYAVQPSAPLSMPTDPGHEFLDTVEQLGGQGASYPPGGPYPPIDMSGFAANYATSMTEGTGLPSPQEIGDVMACFDTPTQLPVLYQLATEFALCDHWFSSMPGPTWPNRFFVHGASSSGLDDSPSTTLIGKWESPDLGFKYPNGSIYGALDKAGICYRFYHDSDDSKPLGLGYSLYSDDPQNGSFAGAIAQVSSLSGVTLFDINSLKHFASDLQGPYPYPYTFIEPHYGDIRSGTYVGGSSQHPMDDAYGGEHLLASVYQAIRNSPYWDTSLLIITYDEHGGLYDSVAPDPAPAPGDNPNYGYNKYGFNFELYGVRVPAIIVSPLIPAGRVDHTFYDHSSIPKTLEELFGLNPLTKRDAAANSVLHLLSLATPRTDCPMSLNGPAPSLKAAKPRMSAEERARIDAEPLPQSSNLVGALLNLMKAEIELSAQTPSEIAAIKTRFEAIRTRGDAQAYMEAVIEKVRIAKEQRELAVRRKP